MPLQAYDENGNKIKYAIYDTDYVIETPDELPIAVDLIVSRYTPDGLLFLVRDLSYETIATDMTLDQIFERRDWVVGSVWTPLDDEIEIVMPASPRKAFDDMLAIQTELKVLREERNSARGSRFHLLESAYGPIRTLERMANAQRVVVNVTLFILTGQSVSTMRNWGM